MKLSEVVDAVIAELVKRGVLTEPEAEPEVPLEPEPEAAPEPGQPRSFVRHLFETPVDNAPGSPEDDGYRRCLSSG